MRRQLIERHQLRFDEQLPQASDSDFIARYLLLTRAAYTLVPLAVYEYRRRGDGSSIVDQQQQNVTRYKLVFGRAHRRLLELSAHETGSDDCPQWLANTILYFTFYLFRRNRSADSPVYETDAGVLAEIRGALQKNLRSIGAARIRAFRLHDVPLDMRAAWLAAAQGELRSSPVERLGVVASESTACVSFVSSNLSLPRGLRIEGRHLRSWTLRRAVSSTLGGPGRSSTSCD
ncbi:hypothetical protein G7066_13310 [Leucobacter coleopterorum]|uniref:McrBC 5-methylcytosine restriction system component n=1 Tax=Leucobacter coleopterorum TaxID=2714933 RepID=A0ABX6JY95_9MICO|nr:hypothetical protein G7066_13310 [Leucobacter coleopterorum]